MKIALNELNYKKEIELNIPLEKDEELDKRIKDLKNATFKGKIYLDNNANIQLEGVFAGEMELEDSITLEPLYYKFKINLATNYEEIKENYPSCVDFSKNILDLKHFLWQNIVLEVPISMSLAKNISLKGEGWKLQSGDNANDEIDPRLKKLEDLLKGDD